MASLVDSREFGQLARALRRAPKAVRDQVKTDARRDLAQPLASRISQAAHATGPWGDVLARGTKTRAGVEPVIVVGGKTPKLSGGGGPRSVVFGTEWGGGKRITQVYPKPKPGRKLRKHVYARYSTNQFHVHQHAFIFPTIVRNYPKLVDGYADIVLRALEYEMQTRGVA